MRHFTINRVSDMASKNVSMSKLIGQWKKVDMELRGRIVEEDSCKKQGRTEWGDGD